MGVAWGGGIAFIASLAYFVYTYVVTLGAPHGTKAMGAGPALAIDCLLFLVFAAHHSLFVRPPVSTWIRRFVPRPLERSVYVWTASLLLALVCAAWQPLPGSLYHHTGPAAAGHGVLVAAGIALTALGARRLNPLELAGIEQAHGRQRASPTSTGAEALVTRFPYSFVRHPIYLGWVLFVFGVAHMTSSRLLMASLSTAYLVMAVSWEERRLERVFGGAYAAYRQRVRWRILPFVY